MKKKGLVTIAIICLVLVAGVLSISNFLNPGPVKIITKVRLADDSNATAESVSSLIDSLNDFSFRFYNQIGSAEDGNIFFSPYSIFVALSMAYEGAKGNTAIEMQNILNILQNDSVSLGSFGRVYNLLNQKQEGYTISTANAFWAHQDYEFLNEYLS